MFTIVVTSGAIIQRMLDELVKAKHEQNNRVQMKRHIENVQLLCDVILADSQTAESSSQASVTKPQSDHKLTEQEIKAMIGQRPQTNKMNNKDQSKRLHSADDNNLDSDSLFDF